MTELVRQWDGRDMNRLLLADVLTELHKLIDTIADSITRNKIESKLDRLDMLLSQASFPSVYVEQNIKEVAEQAQVIGAIIQQSDISPQVSTQLQQILAQLVKMQKRKVFVSSIGDELLPYQNAVVQYLNQFLVYEPIIAERPDQMTSCSFQPSIDNVERCQLFLGIYAERYDTSNTELCSDSCLSPTELELDYARTHFRRCLCFLSHPGTPGLAIYPPDKPTLPEPPRLLVLPPFSEYYRKPGIVGQIWGTVKSWLTETPSPKLRLEQERYEYEQKRQNVDASNKRRTLRHQAEVQQICQAWEKAFSKYKYQESNQKAFRQKIEKVAFPIYQFSSVQELESQLNEAFEKYRCIELTGLAPFDIRNRWSRWQLAEQESLIGAPLYWRPLLPSSIEMTREITGEKSQEKSLWQSFLEYEWHRQIQELFYRVHHIALTLQSEPCMGQFDYQLVPLPGDFFRGNYEHIGGRLWKWCSELESRQQVIQNSLEEIFKDAKEILSQWDSSLESLQDRIKDSQALSEDLEIMRNLAEEIHQAKNKLQNNLLISEVEELPFTFSDDSFTISNENTLSELRQWYKCEKSIRQTVLEYINNEIVRIKRILYDWRASTMKLAKAVKEPQYGRCLLLMGRSGSGKTHLLARLLEPNIENGVCVLSLGSPQKVKDWSDLLLRAAQLELTSAQGNPVWRSLEELDHYLDGRTVEGFPRVRLVIIISELEAWIQEDQNFLKGLFEFIAAHSQLHTLYWVLTLSEYAYDLVIDKGLFWKQYGFCPQRGCSTSTGWLSLDQLNQEMAIWVPILKTRAIQPNVIDNIHHYLGQSSLQLLCMPFISWVIAELLESGTLIEELIDLNYIDFVEKFWNLRLKELLNDLSDQLNVGGLEPELEYLVWLIAGEFAVKGKEQFVEDTLLEYLKESDHRKTKLKLKGVVDAIIEALVAKNLMRRPYAPEHIAEKGRTVDLSILPFWQYWGGYYLTDFFAQKEYDSDIALLVFKKKFSTELEQYAQESLSGVLEFTILHLDQHTTNKEEKKYEPAAMSCAQKLSRFFVKEMPHMRKNIWLAAVKASPSYQLGLAQWLDNQSSIVFDQQDDLFHYMYFLKNAKLMKHGEGLSAHLRVKLLQTHYVKIKELKLQHYFTLLVEQLFAPWIEGAEIARSIAYLYGVECFCDVEQWSNWAFEHLCLRAKHAGSVDWETVAQSMLIMLAEVSKMLGERRDVLSLLGQEYETDPRDRLWAKVVGKFCSAIVKERGVHSINWLDDQDWFEWSDQHEKLDNLVEKVMEEQLTTTLGTWYAFSSNERESYIVQLEAMIFWESRPRERVTAGFLIYHTIPKANISTKIDENLWRLLNTLYEDEDPGVKWMWRIPDLKTFYGRQYSLWTDTGNT